MRIQSILMIAAAIASSSVATAADLTQVRDTLREADTSIASVRLVYRSGKNLDLSSTYLESGSRKGLIMEAPGDNVSAKLFDGQYGYEVLYHMTDDGKRTPKYVRKEEKIPGPLVQSLSPLLWSGRAVGLTGKPLWQLLDGAAKIIEVTSGSVADGDVLVVELGEIEEISGRSARYVCHLASARGFSPIKVTREVVGDPSSRRVYTVASFRQVGNRLLGRDIWFPETMEFDFGTMTGRVELVAVEFNPDLNAALFIPEPGKDTRVVDKTAPSHTSAYDPFVTDQIVTEASSAPAPPTGSEAIAEPPSRWFIRWLWIVVSVVAFAIAGGVWWSRSD